MINNIHYEEALNNILIVVIAAAVVLVLVMLLGSKKSRFRKKLSTFFADDTVGTAMHAGVRLTQMVHRNCTMNTMN